MKPRHLATFLLLLFITITITANAQNPVFNVAAPVTGKGDIGLATSTTDNAITRFDSTAGNTQNSLATIDDNGRILVPTGVNGGVSVGDTTTGIYQAAASTMSFRVGAVQYGTLRDGTTWQFPATTVLRFINLGTASAPVISGNSDTNTGIYWSGPDAFDISTGGTRRAGWNSSGNFDTTGNATVTGTLSVGGGATLQKLLSATAPLDFGSIATLATAELTITVTGAAAGDSVSVGAPAAIDAGLVWCGYVSAADTVTVRVYNSTIGGIDPASATWRATVQKF